MWIDANIFIAVVICYVLYVIMHWRSKRDVLELKDRVAKHHRVQQAIEALLIDPYDNGFKPIKHTVKTKLGN
jgi:hypothetical protein